MQIAMPNQTLQNDRCSAICPRCESPTQKHIDRGDKAIGSLLCIQPFCVLPKLDEGIDVNPVDDDDDVGCDEDTMKIDDEE
jgi:hypothetical protein